MPQKNLKKIKKMLDKQKFMWYNKSVIKRESNTLDNKKIWVATYARKKVLL